MLKQLARQPRRVCAIEVRVVRNELSYVARLAGTGLRFWHGSNTSAFVHVSLECCMRVRACQYGVDCVRRTTDDGQSCGVQF